MKMRVVVLLSGLAVLLSGCLDVELRQTVYLELDGSAVFHVHVMDKSEYGGPEEPMENLQKIFAGEDPVSEAMWVLGALDVAVVPIRDRPPFEYVVRGTFSSVDPILSAIFEGREDIRWEVLENETGRMLRFSDDYPGGVPSEGKPLELSVELIAVDGRVVALGDQAAKNTKQVRDRRVTLRNPRDWRDLTFYWDLD